METGEMLTGDLKLDIGGEHFEMSLTIPAAPVTPRRMLPVLRKLTDDIVSRGIERSTAAGAPVSCSEGCAGCCRQALLISEAEAFDLYDLVESMPTERRLAVEQRFREARERFEKLEWFNRFDAMSERAKSGPDEDLAREFVALLSEYIDQRVACPFLENEACSIYESRPLTCREYLVTSPAGNCASPRPESIRKMAISGSPAKAFSALVQTANTQSPSSLLLIRLMEFAETHTERFEKRPGPAWADDFFRQLTNRSQPGMPEKAAEAGD